MSTRDILRAEYESLCRKKSVHFEPHKPVPDSTRSRVIDAFGRAGDEAMRSLLETTTAPVTSEGMWGKYDQLIRQKIQSIGYAFTLETYVNEFPTGLFNAQAFRVDAGAVVLINAGLARLAYAMAKLFSASINIGTDAQGGSNFRGDGTDIASSPGQDVSGIIAELVAAYLAGGEAESARRLPVMTGVRGVLVTTLTIKLEEFVLAHEYAHIVANHLTSDRHALCRTPVGDIEVVKKSVQEELEADDIALRIVLADYREVFKAPALLSRLGPDQVFDLQMTLAGLALFFAIDDLIVKVIVGLSGDLDRLFSKGHPPSVFRAARLLHNVGQQIGKAPTQTASALFNWIEHQMDGVVDHIRRS